MAKGALTALGVDISVAVTGIAGPTGGTPTKPVGLVYIAAASKKGVTVTENHFEGDREAVRLQTVEKALLLLREQITLF
jgi:nicotinamide-nucleotide amidase